MMLIAFLYPGRASAGVAAAWISAKAAGISGLRLLPALVTWFGVKFRWIVTDGSGRAGHSVVTKSPCLFAKNVVRMFGDCDSATSIPIALRFAWTISPKRAKFGLFAGPTPWTVIGVWTPDFSSAALAFFTLCG